MERLENLHQLRSHRRWESLNIIQTIQLFQEERRKKKEDSWGQYWSFFRQYETAARQANEEFAKKWSRVANESDDTKLPPYYRLCYMVQAELVLLIRTVYSLRPVTVPLSYFLAFTGLGHGLTSVGRKYWLIVLRKYWLFFCACVGFWTDETYEAYGVADLVKEFTISDPTEATVQFIPLIIASRAILLQALDDTR